jgi:hypothetical protein
MWKSIPPVTSESPYPDSLGLLRYLLSESSRLIPKLTVEICFALPAVHGTHVPDGHHVRILHLP